MGTNVTFNGQTYTVPGYNDTGYAQGSSSLTAYLIALASGCLQQSGGLFQLTAEADFGSSYGIKVLLLKTAGGSSSAPGHTFAGATAYGMYQGSTTLGLAVPTGGDIEMRVNGTQMFDLTGTSVSIRGTNTNDNATSGFVGEAVRSSVTTAVNSTGTGQWTDITSITLSAGDWDVTGQVVFNLNSATQTVAIAAVTSNSGNSNAGQIDGDNRLSSALPISTCDSAVTISNYRVSISGSTTYYLKFRADYSAGTPRAYGRISARRVR